MKNNESKFAVILLRYYNTRRRVLLTGTLLQNNFPELWALLIFCRGPFSIRWKCLTVSWCFDVWMEYVPDNFSMLFSNLPLLHFLSFCFFCPSKKEWFNKPFESFVNSASAGDAKSDSEKLLSNEERMLIIHRLHGYYVPSYSNASRVKSSISFPPKSKSSFGASCPRDRRSCRNKSATRLRGRRPPRTLTVD